MYSNELEQPERAKMDKVTAKQESNQEYSVVTSGSMALVAMEPTQEAESVLRRAAEKIVALNTRSGAHAYELGATFAEAKPLLPERGFGKWLKTFSDYTVRSAWNYISIHERLNDYREQLLSHAVMPTVMFELAKGEPVQIEAVIARMADGERIRVKDVREMFGHKPSVKSEAPNFDIAGVAGLRKVAAAKIDEDIARFIVLMTAILTQVEKALEPLARKKAVVKKTLQEKVIYDCRHAHDLLNSIGAPLQPDVTAHMNWRAAKLPEGTAWRKVQGLLRHMGGADWPERTEFAPWLQNEVVPLLRFVVHGEALASEEIANDLDTGETDASDVDGLIPFDQMPEPIKERVDEALAAASDENREDIRSVVYFDPKPSKRQAA